jgi:hypothetical protein
MQRFETGRKDIKIKRSEDATLQKRPVLLQVITHHGETVSKMLTKNEAVELARALGRASGEGIVYC